jgi:hypothetical protein
MRFCKLRIAWSAFWAVICVLLIMLWVRSYRLNDILTFATNKPAVTSFRLNVCLVSNWGYIQFTRAELLDNKRAWNYWNQPGWWRTDLGFEWRDDGAIKVPDSILIVSALAFGVAPWLSYKRFTLRTLLIATTAFATAIGLVVYTIRNSPPGH